MFIFHELVRDIMEVYVNDMVVKSTSSEDHQEHLKWVLDKVWEHNMRLNPAKYFFAIGGNNSSSSW